MSTDTGLAGHCLGHVFEALRVTGDRRRCQSAPARLTFGLVGGRYFDQPTGKAEEPGRFAPIDELEPVLELAPGISSRPLIGSKLLASFVRYEPDAVAPLHSHAEEQLFVVLDGQLELQLDTERRLMRTGDAALIPAWVPHSVRAVSGPAHQLDVFSPPRAALLDLIKAQQSKV